jgi:hypothetical protein
MYPKSYDIAAYTYAADLYCQVCIIPVLCNAELIGDYANSAESVLDLLAPRMGIDRYEESSYDSGDFPKVVFNDQVSADDRCGSCGELL